ncbi:MAG: polysaccharide pyruvyl transferase family protein [Microbacteriaceae bacterium]|nr:polysaccharide pyruvyl transferase family protein [Microbacteriaceae bacterium]
MTKHIVIIGSALSGNKGAAAMLESAVQTLGTALEPVEFTLLSMYPDEDAALNLYPNLRIVDARPLELGVRINTLALVYRLLPPLRATMRKRYRAIRALASADALLDQGGITFVDGREKFLLYNVASILPALNMKVPVVKCAQALGTFRNPINRWAATTFLPKMATIVSRGAVTQQHLDELGLTNTVPGADYAFLLELTDAEKAEAEQHFDRAFFDTDRKVVGLSPSVVMQKNIDGAGGDYAGELVEFMRWLIDERGYRVALIPHSVRTGTDKTHNNDLPLCRDLAARFGPSDDLLFIETEMSSQGLRHVIGLCDLFVASRFHAMVSSLAMAVPTLVIGWSHKYQEVLDMFGLAEWAFGRDKFSQAHLRERFDALAANEDEVRGKLRESLPAVKDKARVQVDEIVRIAVGSR